MIEIVERGRQKRRVFLIRLIVQNGYPIIGDVIQSLDPEFMWQKLTRLGSYPIRSIDRYVDTFHEAMHNVNWECENEC